MLASACMVASASQVCVPTGGLIPDNSGSQYVNICGVPGSSTPDNSASCQSSPGGDSSCNYVTTCDQGSCNNTPDCTPPHNKTVPDLATTVYLLGLSLLALEVSRRKFTAAKSK